MIKLAGGRETLAARFEALLLRHWWRPRPSWLAASLVPFSWVYRGLFALRRWLAWPPQRAPVPLLVVGNLIVGGGGKTPTVIALVQAFVAAGRRPGVVSRGYGRGDKAMASVSRDDSAENVGDEPLLIARRTGVPVWVGRDRVGAARALCAEHPEVDLLLSDDGLQHQALAREAELLVFDARGVGNGLLLPAGPLRQALPRHMPPRARVLYTVGDGASTALAGPVAKRLLGPAWPLASWQRGDRADAQPLASLRGRPLLAVAGLAAPEPFFAALEGAGLTIERLPLPDHHPHRELPWPPATTDVITTEKDAVKIARLPTGSARVWVVPLDLQLPDGLADELLALLKRHEPR